MTFILLISNENGSLSAPLFTDIIILNVIHVDQSILDYPKL